MPLKVQFFLQAFLPFLARGACVSLFLSYLCDYSFQWCMRVNYGTPVCHTTRPGFLSLITSDTFPPSPFLFFSPFHSQAQKNNQTSSGHTALSGTESSPWLAALAKKLPTTCTAKHRNIVGLFENINVFEKLKKELS